MATKATPKTEVAEAAQTAAAMFSNETPEWVKNGQGRGSENVTTKDMILPRLEIVQAQSPIKDENPAAAEGMLFNTVTQEVIGDTAFVIPIFYRMEWLVWKDQDEGGGFFGAFDSDYAAQQRRLEVIDKERLDPGFIEVIDTPVHYCLLVKGDMTTDQIVVSMPRSKAKVSRKWNTLIQLGGGDRFSRAYKLTTFKDKNKQNKTFFNFVVTPAGFAPKPIFDECERLYSKFKTEDVRADHASAARAGSDEGVSASDDPQI